ncbi:response regulator [Terricaulis sp.]|uniref:response regulator n=1 Tax=Terricaulis sp. TaxID=2768686 RepID=UPI0037844C49
MTQTVLAIDDSLTVRELVNFVLGNAGYKVVLAEDGVDGLAQLEHVTPDVIITDINMPRLDGFGFIARARETKARATPILVLTTEGDAEKKARAKAAGATGWIIKPFNPNQLVEAVRRVAQ